VARAEGREEKTTDVWHGWARAKEEMVNVLSSFSWPSCVCVCL